MDSKSDIVAIIPARGGSKRIPQKNIVDFHGKPMIAWAIETALEAKCFSRVIVSTDCIDIANVAKQCGAEVPFLRESYSDDHSPISEATCWTVEKLIEDQLIEPAYIVQMMANVPLKKVGTIRRFVDELVYEKDRSLVSCFEPKFSPPHWAIEKKADGTGQFAFDKFLAQRSQDLPNYLIPTGAIWGAHWNYLREYRSFYGPKFRVFEMDWVEALDIDTPAELEICKTMASHLKC